MSHFFYSENTLNATLLLLGFFSPPAYSNYSGLEKNKSRDNWFVGLRLSLFSRVIIQQLHYGWQHRNPSLAYTNIYREDVGREKNALAFNTKRSLATRTCNAQKHANTIHNRAALTLPPAVRRRKDVSGGVKRRDGGGEGGGVNYLLGRQLRKEGRRRKTERQM